MAILQHLKAAGIAGATVTRGIAGFGAHSQIKTANILGGLPSHAIPHHEGREP
jgi:PII-like signaling protein